MRAWLHKKDKTNHLGARAKGIVARALTGGRLSVLIVAVRAMAQPILTKRAGDTTKKSSRMKHLPEAKRERRSSRAEHKETNFLGGGQRSNTWPFTSWFFVWFGGNGCWRFRG